MAPKPRTDPFASARAAAAAHLPEVEKSTSYGTRALKVRGKSFARLKDADTMVVMCAPVSYSMATAAQLLLRIEGGAPSLARRPCARAHQVRGTL